MHIGYKFPQSTYSLNDPKTLAITLSDLR